MDNVKNYLLLPAFITFQGVQFKLLLEKTNTTELRLIYNIHNVCKDSVHFNDINNRGSFSNSFCDYFCDFLYIYEGIKNDDNLRDAIKDCVCFIKQNEKYFK